jgi:hypothetical protein
MYHYDPNLMLREEVTLEAKRRGWPPLTVERVLVAARMMASLVRLYQLLCEIESYATPVSELRHYLADYMARTLDTDWFISHLSTTTEGLRVPVVSHDPDIVGRNPPYKIPRLGNESEVIATAIAYLEYGIAEALKAHPVYPALANRGGQAPEESIVGAWVAAFRFDYLLAAFWWQFYSAILNRTQFKECSNERCLALFVPIRSDQEYCDRLCRDAQRKRKKYQIQKREGNNQVKEA